MNFRARAHPLSIRNSIDNRAKEDVRSYIPGRTTLILAGIACVLTVLGIALNYFVAGRVEFAHCVLALGLLAFVVWFSGRKHEDG